MPFELPQYCYFCGVVLQGLLTAHEPDCPIRRMIEENFPNWRAPEANE